MPAASGRLAQAAKAGHTGRRYKVAFSWQPDGKWWPPKAHQRGGLYTHILLASGPREGNWWFWIQNDDGHRISDMAHVQTDEDAHEGSCQQAVIDFDIQDPGLTYVGRKLHVSSSD